MIELIWGLINILILVSFILICFKAVKLIKEKFGVIQAIILTFGLLSFMSFDKSVYENENKNFNLQRLNNISEKVINDFLIVKVIDKSLTNSLILSIKYSKLNNVTILKTANASKSGFVMGINWNPTMINVHKKNEKSINYYVVGQKEWRLLGLKIFSESKKFNGKINLEN